MNREVLIQAESVSKKFCRNLKCSMWYGFQDVFRDTLGLDSRPERLRPDEFWAVDDVSFELREGECLGLIGPNGSGKSTLLKVLNGILRPDQGCVKVKGRLGALIEVGAGFHPQLSGRENIYVNASILGMSKGEIDSKFKKIVEFADIGDFLDSPVKFYSSGMFVRLGMAVAVHTDPAILLIDEVFAVGDINFQAKCLNRIGELRRKGVAFILVSHNIHHIAGYADRVLVLNRGRTHASGESGPTVRRYLELMRSQQTKHVSAKGDLANGSGRVRFTHVRLRDESGCTLDRIDPTSPFLLEIEYVSIADLSDLELDICVYDTSRNEIFFQVSNLMRNQPLELAKGKGKLTVHFSYFPKNVGRLHFTLTLWSSRREELFDWRREILIDTGGCSLSAGTVWIPCSFTAQSHRHASSEVTFSSAR